jgi:hypothetical protein
VGWLRSCGVFGTGMTGVGVGVDETAHPINGSSVNKNISNLLIVTSRPLSTKE